MVRQVALAHYREGDNSVLCFTCIKTNAQKKLQWSLNAESAFISTGFTNWKKASKRFSSHGASECHKQAVMHMITLPATTLNIEHQREQLEDRQCFLKILSNIIESVDSISKDERGFPLTQYITNGRISRGGYTFTHFKHHHRVLRLISYRMGV